MLCWLLCLGSTALLPATGWAKGPVETAFEARLIGALHRRGFAVTFGAVEWNGRTRLRVHDLQLYRADLKLLIDRIDLEASAHYLLRGDVRIVSIAVGTARATVRPDLRPATPGRSAGGAGGQRYLARGATISVAQLDSTIERRGKALARLSLVGPTVSLAGGEQSVVGDGTLRFAGRESPVHFDVRRGGGVLRAEARARDAAVPLISIADPAHGSVAVGGGAIEQRDGTLEAFATALAVRLGPRDAPLVQVTAERARYHPDGVVLEGGQARANADPRRALGHARALLARWRSRPDAADPGVAPSEPPAAPSAPPNLTLERFELAWKQSSWRMTEARLRLDDRGIHVDGRFGGGRLKAQLAPGALTLELDAVRLDGGWRGLSAGGTLSGSVAVTRRPWRIAIDGHVRDGRLAHPAIAAEPLRGIDAGFKGTLAIDKGAVAVEDAQVRLGKAVARTSLRVTRLPDNPLSLRAGLPEDFAPVIDLEAEVEPVRCQDAIAGVPDALLGPVRDVKLSGFFRPRIKLRLPFGAPRRVRLRAQGISKGGCAVDALNLRPAGQPPADVAAPLDDVAWLEADFVLPVREGVSEGTRVEVGPGTPDWVPLEELPPWVGGAAYLSEEMGFYTGSGISLPLVAKALGTNLAKKRFAYGGSTVTQQLVKNLFLTRDKTLARKLQEAIIAARIARSVSKDRVLELYLNCIEFGPDLYGIGRAAEHYFQKPASALTPLEAVFLAMLKPAPRRGRWYVRKGRTPEMPYWAQRSRLLLERLEERALAPVGTADAAAPFILRWAPDGRYAGPVAPAPLAPPSASPPD